MAKKEKNPKKEKKEKGKGKQAPAAYPKGKMAKDKEETTLHEFKEGDLHSGSKKGPVVTDRKQAIAIALNQARKATKKK